MPDPLHIKFIFLMILIHLHFIFAFMAKPALMNLWLSFVAIFTHLRVHTLAQTDNYIIHMDLAAMPKAFSGQHRWYESTLSSVVGYPEVKTSSTSRASVSIFEKLIYTYNNVMNGFSANLSPAELEALRSTQGFIHATRDVVIKADTTHSSKFIGLDPYSGAWPKSKYGKDVIIGLVDTGIWPESESFRDDGMSDVPSRWKGECVSGTQFNSSLCNKKLIGARFFNKGLIAKNPNITISMNSTRDTDGHGTHTSSTAAGGFVENVSYFRYAPGTASGMAPQARVAMYKALWDEGAVASDILAAIDHAIADGVDVLSLSLGLDGIPLYEDPIGIATFGALQKGIFVTTSAGNEGPFLETLHNGTPWVITVAAGTVDREFHCVLTLGDGVTISGLSLYVGNFSSSPTPIVFMGSCDKVKELIQVKEKIVVCEDRNNTLSDQISNVNTASVTGAVFITNNSDLEFSLLEAKPPLVFLNPKNGEIVKGFITKNSEAKVILSFAKTQLDARPAPSVTSYSSRGPSQSCPFVLKPDIMAPGSMILAAWPSAIPVVVIDGQNISSNYNLLSGTSMACPHVAGVAALIKAVHPEWSPAAIRSAIMTTSDTLDNTHGPIRDIGNDNQPANPLAFGSGHIDPDRALDPGLVYDADYDDYVNLLCALNYTQQNITVITKSSSNNCSNPSIDLNYPSFIGFFNFNDSASGHESKVIREFHRTVTNVGEGGSTYVASVTPIEGFQLSVLPNKLVFEKKNEKQSYLLRIEGPSLMKESVAFGYLTWEDGQHVVKSPIVVTNLNSKPLPMEE